MTIRKQSLVAILALVIPTAAWAQEEAAERFAYSGHITPAGQLTNDPASSKFNEYRDMKRGVFIKDFGLDFLDTETGRFAEIRGNSVFREDQNITVDFGKYSHWRLGLEWDELRHLLSKKAQTPYLDKGNGLFEVPATIPQETSGFVKDPVPSASNFTATNDSAISAYLLKYLHPTDLENDRRKGTAKFEYSLFDHWKFRMAYSLENRDGNKITYGPIGDRPPRTTNIQLTEPVDYKIQEFKFETDYLAENFQLNASYLLSSFSNNIDNMTWQNIYTSPSGTQETWTDTGGTTNRSYATYGKRSLSPDNKFHNVTATFGLDLPWESRLDGTAAFGFLRQDQTLLPYSTKATARSSTGGDGLAWNDAAKLPRATAKGEINTKLYNLDYTISPISRLNLRAFYRFFDLDNRTPEDQWWYVTQDTTGTTGSVNYVNKRKSVAYEYNQKNLGLDTSYGFDFWRTSLGLAYERERVERHHRAANTDENIYRLSLRTRPMDWLSFRTKYRFGDREIDGAYDTNSAAATYWYAASEVSGDNNDPQFIFENHPDTRVYDESDRKQHLFELHTMVNPIEKLDLGASYRLLRSDYNSNVTSTQPLANSTSSAVSSTDRTAQTPGDQLGLLNSSRKQWGVDFGYGVTDDLSFTAFSSWEHADAVQRGIEFDENKKGNPGAISASTELGPWTRKDSQWMAEVRDRTYTIGLGARYGLIPGKLNLTTDHTYAQGKVELIYSGFGAQSSVNPANTLADTYQFGFRTPPTVHHIRYTASVGAEYQVIEDMSVGLGYMFERYNIQDWQQEPNMPWFESVGTENFQRDSSAATATQWGNRLPNLGTYLAPSYVAHVGTVTLTYRF
jgi:MtrB/PioB family decaheme-associated outer membrane protein